MPKCEICRKREISYAKIIFSKDSLFTSPPRWVCSEECIKKFCEAAKPWCKFKIIKFKEVKQNEKTKVQR